MIRNERVEEIMDGLQIPGEFGINVDDDNDDAICGLACEVAKRGGSFFHGVTKCVLVFPEEDEVIKIPFSGQYVYSYDGENEVETFEDFHYANSDIKKGSEWDYCENELIKYKKAVKAGFADFLAATRYYGVKNGYPIYIQEKCEEYYCSEYHNSPISDETRRSYNKIYDRCYSIHSEWVMYAISYYDAERVVAFMDWMRENGLSGDLHSGNIGFTVTGRSILLDFAGYRE